MISTMENQTKTLRKIHCCCLIQIYEVLTKRLPSERIICKDCKSVFQHYHNSNPEESCYYQEVGVN